MIIVPLCAVATVAIGLNNVVIGYKIFGISYDRLVELGIFFVLAPLIINECTRTRVGKVMMVIFVGFALLRSLMLFGDVITEMRGATTEGLVRWQVKVLYFFVIGSLMYFSLLHLRCTLNLYLSVVTVVFMLAVFQHEYTPLTRWAWTLKEEMFLVNMNEAALLELQQGLETGVFGRVSGPFEFAIPLSYAVYSAMAVAGYMIMKTRKAIYEILFLFFLVVGLMTLTRSLLLGSLPVTAFVLMRGNRRVGWILLCCVVGIGVYLEKTAPEDARGFDRLRSYQGGENANREAAMKAGLQAIVENPFYVTGDDYHDALTRICGAMKECDRMTSPHNGFISIAHRYSVVGLGLFFVGILALRRASFQLSGQKRVYFLCVGIGYLIHSSFHNNIVLISEYSILVPMAIFLHEVHLSRRGRLFPARTPV